MPLRTLLLCVLLLIVTSVTADSATRTLSGELSYLQRIALTPDSVAVVEFHDQQDRRVSESRFPTGGRQVPLPFAIEVPTDTPGALRAAIWSHGRPTWVSQPQPVAAARDPEDVGEVRLMPFDAERFATRFRCGETTVDIAIAEDQARLSVGGEQRDLSPVKTASGARYEATDDPDTFFWSKGNNALVGWRGDTLPECAPAVPVPLDTFSASGNEPGWTLRISGAMIQLSLDYGTREVEAPLPSPQPEDGATRYVLDDRGISVTIRDEVCHDDMTGMPHPARVVVETAERRLRGCGGDPRDLLEGGEWSVTAVDDQPLPEDVNVTMEFLDDDRIAGSSGCNRFMGSYTLTGEGLSFGALAGTMMACQEQQMEIEQRVLGVLRDVVRFEAPEPGILVLKTHSDRQLTARRAGL